jgi:myo-inositol-1(or 4)-monophosphatase
MITIESLQKYLEVATAGAIAGGEVLKQYWGKLQKFEEKHHYCDLVTEADKLSEEKIIAVIQASFPEHQILAEERGYTSSDSDDFMWCIDPLDGTTNYIHQHPFVAVSIALMYKRQSIVGVVFNPILNELFRAAKGLGTLLNHHEVRVSQVDDLGKSLLASGFPYDRRETEDNNYSEFCHFTHLTQGVRRAGVASLDLAYVAAGRLDGFWEKGLKSWDMAAGVVLVEEAGGKVTNYAGDLLDYSEERILATNTLLHDAMSLELKKVAEFRGA